MVKIIRNNLKSWGEKKKLLQREYEYLDEPGNKNIDKK